ncbi:MAG: hypothetical protein L0H73_12780 [Nitrococcus sp.]|nr:hypothetical protein [Nitrococcus sp.]
MIQPYWLALLASAYAKAGRVSRGLEVIAEAMETVERSGERWFEADLHRLQDELTLVQVNATESRSPDAGSAAKRCFDEAIGVARQQQAKSLELRAALSLARLWRQQGKASAADVERCLRLV